MRSGIVCVNNVFSPIGLRAERRQCRENIITGVLGIKSLAFRKGVEQLKS
jgi:hypothetical protein